MEEHMNIHLKSETKEAIKAFSISGIIIVLFYLIISNLDVLGGTIGSIFHALLPFIFGMILAFLLIPLRNLAENKLLKNTKFSKRTKSNIDCCIIRYFDWILFSACSTGYFFYFHVCW